MEIKTKSLTLEVKATDVSDGSFRAYGSVWGTKDSYGDIVEKGAFDKTLRERLGKIKLLWQHDSRQPIGVFTNIYEDNIGLVVEGKLLLDVKQGAEAYALIKAGAIDSMSIGYMTVKETYDSETQTRFLKEVKLYEVSLVTFPANEDAIVTSVKSAFESLGEDDKTAVIAFTRLDQKQRAEVTALINNFKKSLESSVEPQVPLVATDGDEHSESEQAGNNITEEPLSPELKHSLEKLKAAMTA